MDFLNISYLNNGNNKQKQTYAVLKKLNIIEKLQIYNPIVVGTIPLMIDITDSDIDIICEVYKFVEFEDHLQKEFGHYPSFKLFQKETGTKRYIVANFQHSGFPFEIYGQNLPTTEQSAFRHMMIEHRILKWMDKPFRNRVLELKEKGIKTEPAFAKLLQLKGDPYQALLELESWDDDDLLTYCQQVWSSNLTGGTDDYLGKPNI